MPSFIFSPTSLPVLNNPMGIGDAKCGACGLDQTCQSPYMPVSGKGRKKILVLAEAPGKEEDKAGRQLVGRSGQEQESVLRSVGINMREDCWLTNALVCRPPNNEVKDWKVIDYCRPNLLKTLDKLKPEIILVLGGVALESLIPHVWGEKDVGGAGRWVGYQIPCQKLNAWICPTWHPAYVMRERDGRNGVVEIQYREHHAALRKLKGRPWQKVPDYESEVEPIFSVREAGLRLKKIKDGDVIAFDYETNCLKPETKGAKLYTCSVCVNGGWTIAFPWDGLAVKVMKRILANRRVKKIASNMKMEDRWSREYVGVECVGWTWDTMLTAHALENATKQRLISSIKFQSFVHLGQRDWSARVHPYLVTPKGSGGSVLNRIKEIAHTRELLIYNGMDSLTEYHVAVKRQMKEMGY